MIGYILYDKMLHSLSIHMYVFHGGIMTSWRVQLTKVRSDKCFFKHNFVKYLPRDVNKIWDKICSCKRNLFSSKTSMGACKVNNKYSPYWLTIKLLKQPHTDVYVRIINSNVIWKILHCSWTIKKFRFPEILCILLQFTQWCYSIMGLSHVYFIR